MATVQDLADALQGTCDSLDEVRERLGMPELTLEQHTELDGLVFLCDECGWWCEACETNENPDGGNDTCDDCNGDNE